MLNGKIGVQMVSFFSEVLTTSETTDTPYPLFAWFSVTNDTPDNYIDVLENRWAFTGSQGSNPCLSAIKPL